MFAKNRPVLAALTLGGALLMTGCAQSAEPAMQQSAAAEQASTQAEALTVTDPWAKAAKEGMSAAFATLSNASTQPIELESVTDEEHGASMQLHEMEGEGTEMLMQQMEEPLVIPAGQEVQLEPGGNHIMYMGLDHPLVAAEVSTLRLHFADGSTKDVDFAIRNYDGANESYHEGDDTQPEHAQHSGGGH